MARALVLQHQACKIARNFDPAAKSSQCADYVENIGIEEGTFRVQP